MKLKDPNAAATSPQTWYLRCLHKEIHGEPKDYRPDNLTMQQAADLIATMKPKAEALRKAKAA